MILGIGSSFYPKYHDYDRIQELFLRKLFSLKKEAQNSYVSDLSLP